jgi:hypothetical protein
VLLLREDLEPHIDASAAGKLREPATVIQKRLITAHLDIDRRQPAEIGVERVRQPIVQVATLPQKHVHQSLHDVLVKKASLSRFDSYDAPVSSMSNQGEKGIAAAGRGSPSSRARSWVVIASPPPEESPVNVTWSAVIPCSSSQR